MRVGKGRDGGGELLSLFGIALAAGLAYYAGSLAGLQLRLPPATPSVLWPPNSILTGALLVAPLRFWPAVLLGALPAHLAAQLPTEWPVSLVLALFGTNCFEAVLGAAGVRLLSDQPTRFDTLHRFLAFLGAAVLAAPLLSTFADAAAVAWWQGEPYWTVWSSRLTANILAQLIVTPVVVGALTRGPAWLRGAPAWRYAEVAVMGSALVVVSWLSLTASRRSGDVLAVSADTPLVAQLPFLLWAALRFGPFGSSLALLTTTGLTAWAVVNGGGPYRGLEPEQLVLTAQLFLIAVGVTVLAMATLIEERRRSMHALAERLRLETLVSEFSRSFVDVTAEEMDGLCREWLARIGRFLDLDGVQLFTLEPGERRLSIASDWRRDGRGVVPYGPDDVPWINRAVMARTRVVVSSLDALPAEALVHRRALERHGCKALLVVPLLAGDRAIGALAFASAAEREWPDDLVTNLQLLAEVLANAGARRQTNEALRGAQIDAQRSRQELAHVARVSSMGELTASLAHQLNQPLTAIMSNAQAARRLLASSPDVHELRDIMSDIVDDARRAGEVIQRLREFLRKGQFEMLPLDINAAIRNVVNLVHSDAVIRNVTVVVDLDGHSPTVLGDRVQLQQVMLNLLVNAMEAIGDGQADRVVRVSCDRTDGRDVRIRVRDTGVGLTEDAEYHAFDPFFTTKAQGMGVGLSIARSIIERHGGTIQARNDAALGTVVEFTLPAAEHEGR
jgi:signal transduction histidine kinase/integral membrane sensor domain MASE1